MKFAKCGYGSQGQGLGKTKDGYTYLVNDNVRTGDQIQVISTSSRGRKFPTTAVPLHTYKETSAKGQEAKQQVQERGKEVTQSYTGKELGVQGARGVKQQELPGIKPKSQYVMETRAANLAKYLEQNPTAELSKHAQETFDSYSKKFM